MLQQGLRTKLIVAIGAVAVLVAGCGGGAAPGAGGGGTRVTFRQDWISRGYHAPFYLADKDGYYKQAGLNVSIDEGSGSSTSAQLVATGKSDFALVQMATLMQLVSKGAPLKAVAVPVGSSGNAVMTLTKSGIHEPSQLVGKTIGVSVGGNDAAVLPLFLSKTNIPESSVKSANFQTSARESELAQGKVDAIIDYAYNVPLFKNQFHADVSLMPFEDYGLPMLGYAIVTSDNTIKTRPEVVGKFVCASLKGWNEGQARQADAISALGEKRPTVNKEIAASMLDIVYKQLLYPEASQHNYPIGVPPGSDVVNDEHALAEAKLLEKTTGDAGTYYDDEFAKKCPA